MSRAPEALRIDRTTSGSRFWIQVSPGAGRDRVGGLHGDALRVAVTAVAVEGRAHAGCSGPLARALGVTPGDVALAPISKERRKRVDVAGDFGTLEQHLGPLASLAVGPQVR